MITDILSGVNEICESQQAVDTQLSDFLSTVDVSVAAKQELRSKFWGKSSSPPHPVLKS